MAKCFGKFIINSLLRPLQGHILGSLIPLGNGLITLREFSRIVTFLVPTGSQSIFHRLEKS